MKNCPQHSRGLNLETSTDSEVGSRMPADFASQHLNCGLQRKSVDQKENHCKGELLCRAHFQQGYRTEQTLTMAVETYFLLFVNCQNVGGEKFANF
jgi:hypothetical protein